MNRPLVVALAALAAVALAGAAAAALGVWHGQQPPPLPAGDPDVVRLTGPCCPGAPPPPHQVRLADGSTATLQLIEAGSEGGRPVARLWVLLQPGGGQALDLHQGEQRSLGGLTVRVLHVWLVPDPGNRAVDVALEGARTGTLPGQAPTSSSPSAKTSA